jgi:hypothetical protein
MKTSEIIAFIRDTENTLTSKNTNYNYLTYEIEAKHNYGSSIYSTIMIIIMNTQSSPFVIVYDNNVLPSKSTSKQFKILKALSKRMSKGNFKVLKTKV